MKEDKDDGGCNGCTYKDSDDCPVKLAKDAGVELEGNFYCPNGKLRG